MTNSTESELGTISAESAPIVCLTD